MQYLTFDLFGSETIQVGLAEILGKFQSFVGSPDWASYEHWREAERAERHKSATLVIAALEGRTITNADPVDLLIAAGRETCMWGGGAKLPHPTGGVALQSEGGVIIKITSIATSPQGEIIAVEVDIDFNRDSRGLAASIIEAADHARAFKRNGDVVYVSG